MRRVETHAQSFNVDCWRAGVPGSAHCSPMLKEFFQSHCARGFFFRAHLNHRNLTAKRCLSVDVRANFKRKFHRREVCRQRTRAIQTNQARELIRTEPDMLRDHARKSKSAKPAQPKSMQARILQSAARFAPVKRRAHNATIRTALRGTSARTSEAPRD